MKYAFTYLSLLLLSTGLSYSQPSSVDDYLTRLNQTFENNRVKLIEKRRTQKIQLAKQYLQGLGNLEGRYKQTGALEPLLEVRKERDRYLEEATLKDVPPPTASSELAKAMKDYAGYFEKIDTDFNVSLSKLIRQFDASLAELQAKYTQIDKIDEAIKVKARRDEVAALDYVVEAHSVAESAKLKREALAQTRAQQQRAKHADSATPAQATNQFKGSDKLRISKRYEQFIDGLIAEMFDDVIEVIDPEQVTQQGELALETIFKPISALCKVADQLGVDFRTGKIEFNENDQTAIQYPENKPSDGKEQPVNWVKIEGDWYIRL